MWNEETDPNLTNDNQKSIEQRIEEANEELILCSEEAATCPIHSEEESFDDCEECEILKEYVRTFQTHSCTFTCLKKKKIIRVSETEGRGKNDQELAEDLIIPVCRFKFPKFPLDKTTFLYPISKDEADDKEIGKMKFDLLHIKKYLARQTYYVKCKENEESWMKFKHMCFWQFLYELGMFDNIPSNYNNIKRRKIAKERYVNALRMDIKGSGYVYLKRDPKDVFINNFNKKLLPILKANHDIQYVTDHFACANYITSYLTKNESGISKLLKTMEEECKNLSKMETLNRFADVLDKHREVSIQETIYRLLGLPMSKFSTKVKYLNTNHPNFRDGLLKGNIDELSENESVFHLSPHQYYEKRPFDDSLDSLYWEEMTLAEFWANYEVYQKKTIPINSSSQPLLGNSGLIYKRKEPAVLRYYLNYDDPEDLARGLLILFYPFRDEFEDIHEKDVLELLNENKALIEDKRKMFEMNINLVGLIEEIENIQKDKDDIDDEEDEDPPNFRGETTSEVDIASFISSAKSSAQKAVSKREETGTPDIQNIRQRIISLNQQQRKIFDDLCERVSNFDNEEKPFYLYIAGEAGTGKSYLLRLCIDAVRYLKMSSGDEINKPKVIVMAPTANAAFIVKGKTIESALGLNPKTYMNYVRPSPERQSNLKFLYEDVEVIFCDECSMVGSSKLAKINFQLQDLSDGPKRKDFMGGRSFVATGDLRQLPPIHDQLITEKSKLDGRPLCAPSHWDENFRIYYLSEKMRCQTDEEFGNICDRVGKGILLLQDETYLKSRVQSTPLEEENENFKNGKISIIVTTNKRREEINLEKLEKLIKNETAYNCFSTDRVMNVPKATPLSKDLPYTQTGQLPPKLVIKKGAPIVITSNHSKAVYKEDGIMNGARGYIAHIQTHDDDPEDVEIIWIIFNNKENGAKYRADHRHLRGNQQLDEFATPILPIKKRFKIKMGNVEYQRKQFSITLAYALTAHKCQGETFDGGVIVDFDDGYIISGSFYVAITRVKEGNKLFLKNFDKSYIKAYKGVEEKIEEMRENSPYIFKKTYLDEKCFQFDKDDVKIGYLNINCLLHSLHAEYINYDKNLLNLILLCLSDTRLTKSIDEEEVELLLNNWEIVHREDCSDGTEHMGMLLLTPKNRPGQLKNNCIAFDLAEDIKESSKKERERVKVQLVHFKYYDERITFIYSRVTPSMKDTSKICEITKHSNFILGDLNLNVLEEADEQKLNLICGTDKIKHLNQITTVRGNQPDHILVLKDKRHSIYTNAYFNFASDHKSIVMRMSRYVNDKIIEADQSCNDQPRKMSNINLEKSNFDSLDGYNWLNDTVINEYNSLLMEKYTDTFVFSSFFSESFLTLDRGYEHVSRYTKSLDIFNCRLVLFPLLESSHWFLAVMQLDQNQLYILDPFIVNQSTQDIIDNHMKRLEKIENEYLKIHFEKNKKEKLDCNGKICQNTPYHS